MLVLLKSLTFFAGFFFFKSSRGCVHFMSLSCFLLPYVASLSVSALSIFYGSRPLTPWYKQILISSLSRLNSIDLCSLLFLSCLGFTLMFFYFSMGKHAYRVKMFIQILLSLQCYLGTRVLMCAAVTSIQVRGLLCYAFHLSIG